MVHLFIIYFLFVEFMIKILLNSKKAKGNCFSLCMGTLDMEKLVVVVRKRLYNLGCMD